MPFWGNSSDSTVLFVAYFCEFFDTPGTPGVHIDLNKNSVRTGCVRQSGQIFLPDFLGQSKVLTDGSICV